MAYINDIVLDAALSVFVEDADNLYICSQEPTTYSAATTTYALGKKEGITVGSPANRTPNGRQVTISAIADGEVTATGTATHIAIVDSGSSTLLATAALAASQAVTANNTFTLSAFSIGIPDAV